MTTFAPTAEQTEARAAILDLRVVDESTGCWLPRPGRRGPKKSSSDRFRYSRIWLNGRQERAHIVAYEAFVGEVGPGCEVTHSCDNPPCFNPEHLKAQSHAGNMAEMAERGRGTRGTPTGLAKTRAESTHCQRGHEFTPENTYRPPRAPHQRVCRVCRAEGFRKWSRANAERRSAYMQAWRAGR